MRVPLSLFTWRLQGRRSPHRRREHGAAAVVVAISTAVVIGFLAFVTDFGMAYTNKRGLQNGADAAALAVAQEIALQSEAGATCSEMEAEWEGPGEDIAAEYLTRNQSSTDASVSTFNLACSSNNGQLVVEVDTAQTSPTFFGGIAGGDGIDLVQSARAVVAPAGVPAGLRPIAVCKAAAAQMAAVPDQAFAYKLDNADVGCGSGSGNWGMVGFNGSNTPASVANFLNNGYTGPVNVSPATVPGNPGMDNSSAVRAAYTNVLDKEIFLPVYDQITGNGNNATIRIVSFIAVKICAWKTGNGNGHSGYGACWDNTVLPSSSSAAYFQFRYIRAIPIADLGLCYLGNTACDFGLRVVKLAE